MMRKRLNDSIDVSSRNSSLSTRYALALAVAILATFLCWTPTDGAQRKVINPFGVMLGGAGMSTDSRLATIRTLGTPYFRPNSIFTGEWDGSDAETDSAMAAGFRLILTVRNGVNGGPGVPSSAPTDTVAYADTLGQILDRYHPAVLVIENEENSSLFYSDTVSLYGEQLRLACATSRARGVPCANGGLVSTLVALLTWDQYVDSGMVAEANSFSNRVFDDTERALLNTPATQAQIAKGNAFLDSYIVVAPDYVNFHWYRPDSAALEEVVIYLRGRTGRPVITNEIGQQKGRDTSVSSLIGLLTRLRDLDLPYALWFSTDVPTSGGAYALHDTNGTLRPGGVAFAEFIRSNYPLADSALPVSTVWMTDTHATIAPPLTATESFVQINFSGGGITTGDAAALKIASQTGGIETADYIETMTLVGDGDTAVISIWTNQPSWRLFAGLRSDTATLAGFPTGIPANDAGRRALGATTLLIEFADSTSRLLGDSRTTIFVGDSFAYNIVYNLSPTTTTLYRELGFDTSPGSNAFRFYYADTFGGAWTLDTTVTVSVAAGTNGGLRITVAGITKDLPGGLGGVAGGGSSVVSQSNSSCLLARSGLPSSMLTVLRNLRDDFLSFTAGRIAVAFYYGLTGLI